MSKLGRDNLYAERNARIYTNSNEEISAIDENEVLQNIEDSYFNLTDDDAGKLKSTTKFGDILVSDFMEFRLKVLPLFYVDLTLDADDGSSRDRYTLSSFSSNDSSVNVTGSQSNGIDNQITITYSNLYGSSEVRAFSPDVNGSSNSRGVLVEKRTAGGDINNIATFQNINSTCSFEINDLRGNVNLFIKSPSDGSAYASGLTGYRLTNDFSNMVMRIYFWDGLVGENDSTVADLIQ